MAGYVGLLVAGRVSDVAVVRGARTRHVRKVVQLAASLGVAIFLQLAAYASTAGLAGFWMSLALFFGRMQSAAFWVNMLDVCPETPSTVMAISNSLATLPGILGQPITQAILESSGSWAAVFGTAGAVGFATSLVFAALGDDVSLDTPPHANDAEEEVADAAPACTVGLAAGI